jgi:hypothetical protein
LFVCLFVCCLVLVFFFLIGNRDSHLCVANPSRAFLLILIELCWNIYPPQQFVSLLLFGSHLFILKLLWNSKVDSPFITIENKDDGNKGKVKKVNTVKDKQK